MKHFFNLRAVVEPLESGVSFLGLSRLWASLPWVALSMVAPPLLAAPQFVPLGNNRAIQWDNGVTRVKDGELEVWQLATPTFPAYTASNGLTMVGTDVRLGGTLSAVTTINGQANQMNWTWNSPTLGGTLFQNNTLTSGRIVTISTNSATFSGADGLLKVQNIGTSQLGNILNLQPNGTTGDGLLYRADGSLSIGVAGAMSAKVQIQNGAGSANVFFAKSTNGAGGYAVRGESVNAGGATGVWAELGGFSGGQWSGVYGNSGTAAAPAVKAINTAGIALQTSGSHINSIRAVTATTTLLPTDHHIIVNNGATNITLTMPTIQTGRVLIFTRAAGSTGSITISAPVGTTIQSLNGAVGATTSIGIHSVAGGGVDVQFRALGAIWYR